MEVLQTAETWRVVRIQGELIDGIETLNDLGPAVTIRPCGPRTGAASMSDTGSACAVPVPPGNVALPGHGVAHAVATPPCRNGRTRNVRW